MIPVDRVGDMVMVGGEVLSLDAAEELADKIREAVAAARRDVEAGRRAGVDLTRFTPEQREAAREVCEQAGGHDWTGYESYGPPDWRHRRFEWCKRTGCPADRVRDGWLEGRGRRQG